LPVLEYAAAAWDPYHLKDISKLEIVQHRAARFVLNRRWRRNVRDSISEMLGSLKWPPLEQLRKCTRLTLIIHNFVEIPTDYLPILSPITMTRSNHDYKFLHTPYFSITNTLFFPRTTPEWNKLHKTSLTSLQLKVLNNQYLIVFVHISTYARGGPC